MKKIFSVLMGILLMISLLNAQVIVEPGYKIFPFGNNGQLNTTYDARQRPNCVLVDGTLFLVYNGDGKGEVDNLKIKPLAVSFDLATETFSDVVTLGSESSDHHNSPVIWVDMEENLHVFHGWHHDLGIHLVSKDPLNIGNSIDDWEIGAAPSQKMSYEWMSRIYDDKQIVVYRTDGHTSSWTYRISSDNGKTWEGPENDVVDLDVQGGLVTDWSSYHAKAVSKDGNYLHLAFHAYDDYKTLVYPGEISSGEKDKSREFNPLYDNRRVSYNYNLYYVKVDLRTDVVMNFDGDTLQTPINLEHANAECMIWDTEWRGGSIIPSILLDENDQPSFLHNISNYQHEDSLDYHYYRFVDGGWKDTRITHSNHEWNSTYLSKSDNGTLHAYLITGEGYLEKTGDMDGHGGGRIEEWISTDDGNTWQMHRDITPDPNVYPGWKFNNIQPVKRPDATLVEGMLVFYGWKEADRPSGKAFLFVENDNPASKNETLNSKDKIEIYPNPAKEVLNVKIKGDAMNNFAIYNSSGSLLIRSNHNLIDQTEINIAHLDRGVYLFEIVCNMDTYTVKFIK
ncbi:MAG: BNR-4 repeat-containing protein [Bacteroidales bacterium]|nr:BNR-4 repeat-containing protein [Bacteroidales bacterium]MCF8390621.1 BNR-4 repeat-containing protein [Bacteroidales bacterium]